MGTQPSGGGPRTKEKSLSVVLATDHDPMPGLGSGAAAAAADAEAAATTMGAIRSRLMAFNGATWDRVRSGGVAVVSAFVGFLNSIPFAIYNAAPTTRTTGQGGPLEANAAGSLRVAEQNPPAYESAADAVAQTHEKAVNSVAYNAHATDTIAKANTGVLKPSAGNFYRGYFTNTAATGQIIALVNKATNPANGDAPIFYFYVPATTTFLLEYRFGKRFSTGVAWAQVTTAGAATITLTGTSDMLVSTEVSPS